jgi:hypothetical protein
MIRYLVPVFALAMVMVGVHSLAGAKNAGLAVPEAESRGLFGACTVYATVVNVSVCSDNCGTSIHRRLDFGNTGNDRPAKPCADSRQCTAQDLGSKNCSGG